LQRFGARLHRSTPIRLLHSRTASCLHRAPQGASRSPSLLAPRPHRRFAYPPPPPRPARLRLVRPPPPTPTSRPARHSVPTTPTAARFEPASGRLRAGAAPRCAEPAGITPPARFSTASAPDARCSSAPSAPCRLSRCAGAARLGVGGLRETAARERLPTRACVRPGACRTAWRAERRDLAGLCVGGGPAARWWSDAGGRLRAVRVVRWKGLRRADLAAWELTLSVPQAVHEAEACL
jgi:hypothetical protein